MSTFVWSGFFPSNVKLRMKSYLFNMNSWKNNALPSKCLQCLHNRPDCVKFRLIFLLLKRSHVTRSVFLFALETYSFRFRVQMKTSECVIGLNRRISNLFKLKSWDTVSNCLNDMRNATISHTPPPQKNFYLALPTKKIEIPDL